MDAMLTDAQVKKPGTDQPVDPNLQQMQQRAAATPPADGLPLPPPPPLPTAPAADANGAVPSTSLAMPSAAPPAPAPLSYQQAFSNYQSATGDQAGPAREALNAATAAQNGQQAATDDAHKYDGTNYLSPTEINRQATEEGRTYSAFAGLPGVNSPPAAAGGGGAAITPPGGASMSTTLTSAPRIPLAPPPGPASDVGAPSSGVGSSLPPAGPTPIPSPTPAKAGPYSGGPYTAGDVAISSTVLPNADPRLAGTQGMVDSAAKNLANVDRVKLGEDIFNQFSEATDPAYKLSLRRATQSAAGAGRIGSGMLRTSYGDLAGDRARELDLAKRGFMSDALNGSIQDSFNKFGALSGLEGQQFGEGVSNRGELRGERGYQGSLEQQAFERALTQWQLQQGAQQRQFDNGVTSTQVGGSGNPADYYTQLAKQYGVDPSLIAAYASSFSQKGGTTPPIVPPSPRIPPPSGTTPPLFPPD